jgi:hypothetical protein
VTPDGAKRPDAAVRQRQGRAPGRDVLRQHNSLGRGLRHQMLTTLGQLG